MAEYKQPKPSPSVDISNSGYGARKGSSANNVDMSVGNITRGPKEDGITIRGFGAATKGIKARGPMA